MTRPLLFARRRADRAAERHLPHGQRFAFLISRSLVESMISRCLAVYCLVFGAQVVPAAFDGQPSMNQTWAWCIGLGLFGSLTAFVVTGLLGRHAKAVAAVLSVTYLVALVTWPLAAMNPDVVEAGAPWPTPLSTIAFAAAAFAFPLRIASVYVGSVYVVYILVRQTPSGGGAPVLEALGEAGYGLLLGVSVLLLIDMFRRVSSRVDAAQKAATRRYNRTVREHRTELERVQVDSILHDSVLTTFLTAARADTDEERHFAVVMAQHALTEVASARPMPHTVDDLVPLDGLRATFEAACHELGIRATIRTEGLSHFSVPGSVVETFFSAVMQALTNSVQHGGPGAVRRHVQITWRDGQLFVDVIDDGIGFDTETMTPNRLGVRVSIIERVHNVGGEATIRSVEGQGTTVRLRWPRVAG